jgi:hypothetical protein
MKKILKKIWRTLIYPWTWFKQEREMKKRLAELKKRDPFIYK